MSRMPMKVKSARRSVAEPDQAIAPVAPVAPVAPRGPVPVVPVPPAGRVVAPAPPPDAAAPAGSVMAPGIATGPVVGADAGGGAGWLLSTGGASASFANSGTSF